MNTLILGVQWGDEGKSKVIDYLTPLHDITIRFNGGANAGHTVYVNNVKHVSHLIPSCMLHPNKIGVIAQGCAINLDALITEIEELEAKGIKTLGRLFVSDKAHIVMPYHVELDKAREEVFHIGSTKRGIAPCYEDKYGRNGFRIKDVQNIEYFHDKLPQVLFEKNTLLRAFNKPTYLAYDLETYIKIRIEKLKPYIIDTEQFLKANLDKNLLFEGAQGSLLDIEFGQYPFVTSSNCSKASVAIGIGLGSIKIDHVVGVCKSYVTKVGKGEFPSSIEETHPELALTIRTIGKEFGATTGRSRLIGYLDLDSLKEECRKNEVTELALMKSDVLNNLECIVNGNLIFKWQQVGDTEFNKFVSFIERFVGVNIKFIGTGVNRDDLMVK